MRLFTCCTDQLLLVCWLWDESGDERKIPLVFAPKFLNESWMRIGPSFRPTRGLDGRGALNNHCPRDVGRCACCAWWCMEEAIHHVDRRSEYFLILIVFLTFLIVIGYPLLSKLFAHFFRNMLKQHHKQWFREHSMNNDNTDAWCCRRPLDRSWRDSLVLRKKASWFFVEVIQDDPRKIFLT